MDALIVQARPIIQRSFEKYGPWQSANQLYADMGHMDFAETLLHTAPPVSYLRSGFLRRGPRTGQPRGPEPAVDQTCTQWPPSAASTEPAAFSFSQSAPLDQTYDFSLDTTYDTSRPLLKRRRATSDVDGPNTASQGCKKRRLRKSLVTSRLSRPFSAPATHIINREFAASGDGRFLKVAAILSARRMVAATATPAHQTSQPSPSSLLRRAAVVNRFRLKVKDWALQRGDEDVADMATNAALLQQNHGVGFAVGARFPVTSSSVPLLTGASSPSAQGDTRRSIPPFQLSFAAVEARPRPGPPPLLRAAGIARAGLPPSPRTRQARSPVLDDEGLDDEDVAFPTSEHESRYEPTDEPDDVYADFGMIFGSGSADDELDEEVGGLYEDYMDDMDGIPWTVR